MAMANAPSVHFQEYFCALCESRAGTSQKCCCPDDHEKLVCVSEERLRRRINLQEDQKLCLDHARKLRNGFLFGRSDWYECCSPFHVKSPRGNRLRPVPHSWKSFFESPSTDNRYHPRQRICWDCYLLAMEVINKENNEALRDEEDLSGYISPASSDFGYTSPRRWANCLSPQPGSPFGSQFGSSWSLTPSSYKSPSIPGDMGDDNRNAKGAPKKRGRFSYEMKTRSLDYDLLLPLKAPTEKIHATPDMEALQRHTVENLGVKAGPDIFPQSKLDNVERAPRDGASDVSKGLRSQEASPVKFMNEFATVNSDKKPSNGKEDTTDDLESSSNRPQKHSSISSLSSKESATDPQMKSSNASYSKATSDIRDCGQDGAKLERKDSTNSSLSVLLDVPNSQAVVSEVISKNLGARRSRGAKVDRGLSFTEDGVLQNVKAQKAKNTRESESDQTNCDVSNQEFTPIAATQVKYQSTERKIAKDASEKLRKPNKEEANLLLGRQLALRDRNELGKGEINYDNPQSTNAECDDELSSKHTEIRFDSIIQFHQQPIPDGLTEIEDIPEFSDDCTQEGTDSKRPNKHTDNMDFNFEKQIFVAPDASQAKITDTSSNSDIPALCNIAQRGGIAREEECLRTAEKGQETNARMDQHNSDTADISQHGSPRASESGEENIVMYHKSGCLKLESGEFASYNSQGQEFGCQRSNSNSAYDSSIAILEKKDFFTEEITTVPISTGAKIKTARAPVLETDLDKVTCSETNSDYSFCPNYGATGTIGHSAQEGFRFDSVFPPLSVRQDQDQIGKSPMKSLVQSDSEDADLVSQDLVIGTAQPIFNSVQSKITAPELEMKIDLAEITENTIKMKQPQVSERMYPAVIASTETGETASKARPESGTRETQLRTESTGNCVITGNESIYDDRLSSNNATPLSADKQSSGSEIENELLQRISNPIDSKRFSTENVKSSNYEGVENHCHLEKTVCVSDAALQESASSKNGHAAQEQQVGLHFNSNAKQKGGFAIWNHPAHQTTVGFMLEDLEDREKPLNEDQISPTETFQKPDLYKELHGSKANVKLLSEHPAKRNDHIDNDALHLSQPPPLNAPGLRSGNRASEGDRAQFLRRRMNRSHTISSATTEPIRVARFSAHEADVPVIYANRRSLQKDKRRKFGVSFAREPLSTIVLEETVPTTDKGKLVEETLERTSIMREEKKTEVHFDVEAEDGGEVAESSRAIREKMHVANTGKRTAENPAGESSDEQKSIPVREDEDVSAVLSDVFSNAFTLKSFVQLAQSFNTGSTALIALAILFVAFAILFAGVAIFIFVF